MPAGRHYTLSCANLCRLKPCRLRLAGAAVLNYNEPNLSLLYDDEKTNVLSLFFVLAATACSDGSSDSVTDKFKSEFRKGFVEGATEQCVAKVPKTSLLSEETVLQVCTCTAEKMADRISVEDMSAILSGNISENVKEQIKQSTTECLKETVGLDGKRAASDSK